MRDALVERKQRGEEGQAENVGSLRSLHLLSTPRVLSMADDTVVRLSRGRRGERSWKGSNAAS